MRRTIVAAAIVRQDGRILITRRLQGTHLAGAWEFPGGKCETGETHHDCLRRELREELDADADVGPCIFSTAHAYDDRTIEIHFFECTLRSAPRPMLGQEMRWVEPSELDEYEFPPADKALIQMLRV